MSRAEDPLDRAERITAELRKATTEAAGMLKSLEAASKLARSQVDGYLGRGAKDIVTAYDDRLHEEIYGLTEAARATVKKDMDAGLASAQAALDAVASIDYLCRLVAAVVAAATEYTDQGPVLDLSRSLDWEWIDKQVKP